MAAAAAGLMSWVSGSIVVFAASSSGPASSISSPVTASGDVGSIINTIIKWVDGAVLAVAGAWFLFSLYMAIMKYMSGSHHAQKREEAKTHLVHVAIAGVLLGAAGVVAGALYNFGASL
ncbi:MAG: hypothetical protein K6T83_00285 [Alicyclobacillus sp.]|nr:hypothetical protein [Alicyclobacillus sp.]